jgi:glycerol-3-phosphate acyltransferase PlsY
VEMLPALIAGYLLGSIPFGIILTRLAGAGDLRQIGSGNIGATNVLRTGRKGLAAATLLLDGAKGFFAVWLAWRFFAASAPASVWAAGMAAMVGHCFPVWLRFRGGKGVATMLGVGFGFAWPIGLISAATWLAVYLLSKISSLGGMCAALAASFAALATGNNAFAAPLAVIAALVIGRHRENIARLRAGTEPRSGGAGKARSGGRA